MTKLVNINKNLYCFKFTLATDSVDEHNERFTQDSLYRMGQLFLRRTGVLEVPGKTYYSRIFDTWMKKEGNTSKLIGLAYIYLDSKEEVDNVSLYLSNLNKCNISCSFNTKSCSICGCNQFKGRCNHELGKEYGNNHIKCIHELSDVVDVYTWHFI